MQILEAYQSQGRFSYIFCHKLPSWRPSCPHSFPTFYFATSLVSTIRFQLHSIQLKKENGFETYFLCHTIFSLIIGFHLGRHLGYIEMLNDARVASLRFFKDNVCTTRIKKEKNFKIKFQVLLKFVQILPTNRHDVCTMARRNSPAYLIIYNM